MKHLIIGVLILWAFVHISGLIWSSKGQPPSPAFTRLLEPPQQRLVDPYENGYFYLLGFASAATLDPAKTGHEIWIETNVAPSSNDFNYDKPGRAELQIRLPVEEILPSWNAESPMTEFRNMQAWFHQMTGRDRTLLTRYERWLSMPFEDMGFAHCGTPRFAEIFLAHRLYIADGFSSQTVLGMHRMTQDLRMWRHILREATTIATKVMAQIVITDDLHLLSTLLSQATVDKTVLAMTPNIAPPLTATESALRWPLQHQFTLGVQADRTGTSIMKRSSESLLTPQQWLAGAARLPEQAFDRIAHPQGRSLVGIPLQTRETWEMYATYYDAIIHATEAGQTALPTLRGLSGTARQGMAESLLNATPFEPDWAPFHYQLKETDARLRLASLQVVLRRPSAQTTVPNRLAEAGSSYYDPFSGLPMLWSPTQQRIYSVGKDRFDDGGDQSFDVSVPAMVTLAPATKKLPASSQTRRSVRH